MEPLALPPSDAPLEDEPGVRLLPADDDPGLGALISSPLVQTRDLACSACGYGVARVAPPTRCPMCQSEESRMWTSVRRDPPARVTAF